MPQCCIQPSTAMRGRHARKHEKKAANTVDRKGEAKSIGTFTVKDLRQYSVAEYTGFRNMSRYVVPT